LYAECDFRTSGLITRASGRRSYLHPSPPHYRYYHTSPKSYINNSRHHVYLQPPRGRFLLSPLGCRLDALYGKLFLRIYFDLVSMYWCFVLLRNVITLHCPSSIVVGRYYRGDDSYKIFIHNNIIFILNTATLAGLTCVVRSSTSITLLLIIMITTNDNDDLNNK